jgi:outer membrane lipoprotein SlyB
VNRPPSASNRGLAVGPVVGGARGTAIIGGTGMVDPAASRGAFSLNIHGTNGKSSLRSISNKNYLMALEIPLKISELIFECSVD